MNISKIHLHMEKFSLITNWRLVERLLYNQDCKKDPPGIREERKAIRSGLVPLGVTQRKREIKTMLVGGEHRAETSVRNEQFKLPI